MVHEIFAVLSAFIIHVESSMGYLGIVLLMGIESCCIPLPSEVIMPYAGYLCTIGRFDLWLVALAGAVGCVVGSIPAYYLGMYGGRPLILKYGKYILMSHHDLDMADRWFERRGDITVFIARLLPVIRTFIAFPAGVNRMDMRKFIIYTLLGSFPWCLMLAYVGVKVGENIEVLKPYFHRFDAVIGVVLVAGITFWIWRHVKGNRGAEAA
ncbi:MAG: DedA family protein [Armatimonadetes bacterium]|nr:DedA family protein [Armatimonadota bacterium]